MLCGGPKNQHPPAMMLILVLFMSWLCLSRGACHHRFPPVKPAVASVNSERRMTQAGPASSAVAQKYAAWEQMAVLEVWDQCWFDVEVMCGFTTQDPFLDALFLMSSPLLLPVPLLKMTSARQDSSSLEDAEAPRTLLSWVSNPEASEPEQEKSQGHVSASFATSSSSSGGWTVHVLAFGMMPDTHELLPSQLLAPSSSSKDDTTQTLRRHRRLSEADDSSSSSSLYPFLPVPPRQAQCFVQLDQQRALSDPCAASLNQWRTTHIQVQEQLQLWHQQQVRKKALYLIVLVSLLFLATAALLLWWWWAASQDDDDGDDEDPDASGMNCCCCCGGNNMSSSGCCQGCCCCANNMPPSGCCQGCCAPDKKKLGCGLNQKDLELCVCCCCQATPQKAKEGVLTAEQMCCSCCQGTGICSVACASCCGGGGCCCCGGGMQGGCCCCGNGSKKAESCMCCCCQATPQKAKDGLLTAKQMCCSCCMGSGICSSKYASCCGGCCCCGGGMQGGCCCGGKGSCCSASTAKANPQNLVVNGKVEVYEGIPLILIV